MSTLEGWAIPTVVTAYADHTFVYCPDNEKYFGCWAGGSIGGKDAVQICAGTHENAYAVANCYRDSLPWCPDTAGIGIYGINGVCHQSANCFLYAAGALLTLKNGRPGGLLASLAAYGFYGTAVARWYATNYWWCSGKKDGVTATSKDMVFRETHQSHERLRTQSQTPKDADLKISDLAIFLKHAVPGLDLEAIADLQRSYLQEHEGYLRAELPDIPEVKVIDEKSAERVNTLSRQFQKALAQQVGPDNFLKLTGRAPGETIELIDPRILESARKEASKR